MDISIDRGCVCVCERERGRQTDRVRKRKIARVCVKHTDAQMES